MALEAGGIPIHPSLMLPNDDHVLLAPFFKQLRKRRIESFCNSACDRKCRTLFLPFDI